MSHTMSLKEKHEFTADEDLGDKMAWVRFEWNTTWGEGMFTIGEFGHEDGVALTLGAIEDLYLFSQKMPRRGKSGPTGPRMKVMRE